MRRLGSVVAGVIVAAIACGGNADQGGDVATAGASSLGHAGGGGAGTSNSGGGSGGTSHGTGGTTAGKAGAGGASTGLGGSAAAGSSGAAGPGGGGTAGNASGGSTSGGSSAAGAAGNAGNAGTGAKGGSTSAGGNAGTTGTAGSGGSGPAACDPVAQNCLDPVKSKCSLVLDASSAINPACVAPVAPGTGKPGDACTVQKDAMGKSIFGNDTCQKGAICTDYAVAAGTLCRQFCHHTKECAAGFLCDGFDGHHDGACFPTCAPFSATCGAGTCATFALDVDQPSDKSLPPPGAFVCRALGKGKDGDACAVDDDCLGGMLCVAEPTGGQQCRPMCDATHDCAIDPVLLKKGTCEKTLGYAAPWDGIGWCLPPVP